MRPSNRNRSFIVIVLFILGLLLVVAVGATMIYNQTRKPADFALESSVPEEFAVLSSSPEKVVLRFNRELKQTGPDEAVENQVIIYPEGVVGDVKIRGNTLEFIPAIAFRDQVQYFVEFTNITSAKGEKIESGLIQFKLDDTSPKAKFVRSLPYYEKDFSVSYTTDTEQFHIEIFKLPADQTRAKALEYLKSKGYDETNSAILVTTSRTATE